MTEDEMVVWHHRLNGHEFERAPGDGEGYGSLQCCSPGSQTVELDRVTEQQQPKAMYRYNVIHIKIPMAQFTELELIILKVVRTLNSQNNLGKDEQSWKYHNPCFQTILQSCNHQNSMVLAQK